MHVTRRRQRTIARPAHAHGIGFLTGADVNLRFVPAEADTGVVFERVDLPGRPLVPAHVDRVIPRQRRTTLEHDGAAVEMVEHVLAALAGLQVDNCRVEIDASETPGCDGSSQAFVQAIEAAGIVELEKERPALVIDKPISIRDGAAALSAFPGDGEGLILSYQLDYDAHNPIGSQSHFVALNPETFRRDIAPSRTFLLEAEAHSLRQAGVGRRTTEADLLIFGNEGVIGNTLRFANEPSRHKILDMVGDLALLGRDLIGHIVAHRSGHHLNAELARRLLKAAENSRAHRDDLETAVPRLDIAAIMKILPHRYPFLLVDRVLEIDPGKRILALKNISCNEPFFQGHWPERPVMPGVLIVEALAQAAGLMISDRAVHDGRMAVIASLDHVKIRRPVVPGDQLVLEAKGLKLRSRLADVRGVARVEGQVVAEATIRFMLIEAERAA